MCLPYAITSFNLDITDMCLEADDTPFTPRYGLSDLVTHTLV